LIDPIVKPDKITDLEDGEVEVLVHQIVKDLSGNELSNGQVKHIYTIQSGLIQKMDIA